MVFAHLRRVYGPYVPEIVYYIDRGVEKIKSIGQSVYISWWQRCCDAARGRARERSNTVYRTKTSRLHMRRRPRWKTSPIANFLRPIIFDSHQNGLSRRSWIALQILRCIFHPHSPAPDEASACKERKRGRGKKGRKRKGRKKGSKRKGEGGNRRGRAKTIRADVKEGNGR